MYEDIKRNKIKTGFIIVIFILVITLIVYYVCMAFDLGEVSILIALTFSILSAWSSYYYSDKIILSLNKARPATHEEDQKLVNILDALMVSSGLEYRPRLYVVEDEQPNAFATGRNPKNAVVCVTTGLLEKLDYYELEGVVAHELSHIKNYDIRLSAVVSVMVGFVIMISDMVLRMTFRTRRSSRDNDNGVLDIIIFLVGLVFLILSPIVSQLIQLAVSRRREFLADATAISFTRNPDGLISALKKISSDTDELDVASKSNAHMYIVTPFKDKKKSKSNIFSTHPSIEKRIEALENLR